jgi:hypothetical protein
MDCLDAALLAYPETIVAGKAEIHSV